MLNYNPHKTSNLHESVWVYPKNDPVLLKKIIDEFRIHPVTAQILISRSFVSFDVIHDYLYAKLPNLYDPNLFQEIKIAVNRVIKAIEKGEKILIYGDDDADGITATALLADFFKQLKVDVFYHLPNTNAQRKAFLSDALEAAKKHKCSLIITVDCGITAAKEISNIIKNKIDVIITDHHEATSKIPECTAILNPKIFNNTYPNREITGVGVAFKLSHGITNRLVETNKIPKNKIDLKLFLDLVALGTISDMGAMLGENRIFIRYGLDQLKKTKRIGLLKLFNICDVNINAITPLEIASKVTPRLNSLGRVADPTKGIELLLTRNEREAELLAKELDLYNFERKQIERQAATDIYSYIENNPSILNEKAIVLYSNKWHPGIIPVITAKIAKMYNRPTLIISIENGIGKGSIRTIPEFPLISILKKIEHLLINFGGHDFAAGLMILEKDILELKKYFINSANSILNKTDILPKFHLDASISFYDLTYDFMESIRLLEPHGNENSPPLLYCDARQSRNSKIIGHSHLKLYLEQGDRILEGIGFNMAYRKKELFNGKKLRIIFTPYVNTFLNKSSIQLQIKDFKIID